MKGRTFEPTNIDPRSFLLLYDLLLINEILIIGNFRITGIKNDSHATIAP